MITPIVETVGLTKRFNTKTKALSLFTASLHAGTVTVLLGTNGAGKSTLLYLLGGVMFPTSGHVTVFGKHRWKQNFEIRQETAFLPAEPSFGACPNPWDYLQLVGSAYGIPQKHFLERCERLCGEMEMLPHLTKPWTSLSLGMRKKVGLIGAFLPKARLRILDEPFAGGIDPPAMEALIQWIRSARDHHETVLFSTQVLDQAEQAADRIWVLQSGVLRHQGTSDEMIAAARVDPGEPRAFHRACVRLMGAAGNE